MKQAITSGVLHEVMYINQKANFQFFENYKGTVLIDTALIEKEDEIAAYMLKHDARYNSVSLYERHPDKCDQIFNVMANCSGAESVRFLMNLNPQRYKAEISEDGDIIDHSIETSIEELNVIQASEIKSEITTCIICDDVISNLHTKCGHMYCDGCLLL